ncbi:unnamed protein product [Periconia digitata]|uniref:Uncharacterized protein n=1 Tax=Periconia digitata TaxID=1303443 RepID=A0A9W4UKA3_9PLEO|nr:unnamed protein product [Periconia digitata]
MGIRVRAPKNSPTVPACLPIRSLQWPSPLTLPLPSPRCTFHIQSVTNRQRSQVSPHLRRRRLHPRVQSIPNKTKETLPIIFNHLRFRKSVITSFPPMERKA